MTVNPHFDIELLIEDDGEKVTKTYRNIQARNRNEACRIAFAKANWDYANPFSVKITNVDDLTDLGVSGA